MAESDVILRDDILKLNLEAFLPYICECVKATDLLVHLQYFTREQRKEIFKMCAQNNTAAMQRALEILLHETDVPGRFTAIRDALKDSKYPKIVQMLDGDTVPCDENCCRIIDLFTNELVRRLNPEELLPYLVSHDAITAGDAEEVRAEERNHGKRRACWVLLFCLPNRVENWFRIFFEALLHCDYKDVAELLDPDLFHKIMEQKKAAQSEPPEPGKDKIRENILTDASNGSLMEKEDLEQPEKTMSAKTLLDNFDQELEKTSGVGTFLQEVEKLKLSGETACKQLVAEDVTDGKMRNKEGDDLFDSLTDVKIVAQDLARSVEPKKRIQYDKEFLLACKDSPLTKFFPREVEKFPEIMVPITLPRRPDTKRNKREIATSPRRDNIQLETLASNDVNHNTASSNDIIYENNFEDADKDTGMEKMKEGIMDFDFLLAETTNVESQGENVNLGTADDVKQLVEQGDGTIEESKSDVEVDGAVAGLIEVLYARNGFASLGGAQSKVP